MEPLQKAENHDIAVPSVTVQIVLLRPEVERRRTEVYWVLNREERVPTTNGFVTCKRKGWGNPGGGLEQRDMVDARGYPLSYDGMLKKCAARELEGETGFAHFDIIPYLPNQVHFLIFFEKSHGTQHTVYTLAARLRDNMQGAIEEVEKMEIERGKWVDLSLSPLEFLENKDDPLPYYSHVKRTIITLNRLASTEGKSKLWIHPTWRLVFPIGKGDPRFPEEGYALRVAAWAEEMRNMVATGNNRIDLNRIHAIFLQDMRVKTIRQERPSYEMPSAAPDTPEDRKQDTQAKQRSDQSDWTQQQWEEWLRS